MQSGFMRSYYEKKKENKLNELVSTIFLYLMMPKQILILII